MQTLSDLVGRIGAVVGPDLPTLLGAVYFLEQHPKELGEELDAGFDRHFRSDSSDPDCPGSRTTRAFSCLFFLGLEPNHFREFLVEIFVPIQVSGIFAHRRATLVRGRGHSELRQHTDNELLGLIIFILCGGNS